MAPDDIQTGNPASASTGTPRQSGSGRRRAVGPEDEVRGSREAPRETLDEPEPGARLSDPPFPGGTPPRRPDPDQPTPIEEPPEPIPMPPDNPPPPVIEPPAPIVAQTPDRG